MAVDASPVIIPEWPAPERVRTVSTTRAGGVSVGPYASFNLALHVGDQAQAVAENRHRLQSLCGLARSPSWLSQVHGTVVVEAQDFAEAPAADAAYSLTPGAACVVMTADCLPVLFTDDAGTCVAAAHAGWRGLLDGVLEATLARLPVARDSLLAWMGPAIGPTAFEVGSEVREAFLARDAAATNAFVSGKNGRWLCDLYALARMRLAAQGVNRVYGGGMCTYTDPELFYSFRRDGVTGRMASMIWLA